MTAVIEPPYATREELATAADVNSTAYNGAQLDQDIAAASRNVEALLHRKLYPFSGTRYFDYPVRGVPSWQIWFEQYTLIQLDSVRNGDGTTLPLADVFLDPQDGPPYTSALVNLGTSGAYASGTTWQRAVGFTGLWGDSNQQDPAGTLTGALNGSATTIGVTNSSLVGVGSLLTVGSERTLVTGKNLASTAVTLTGSILDKANVTTVPVSSGASLNTGEIITVGSERMQIVDIAGNNLLVQRAVDGTVLAQHASADLVYAPRSLTVVRAATGTTAGTAAQGDPVTVWRPPAPLKQLAVALAVANNQQRYAAQKSNDYSVSAAALAALVTQTRQMYGRFRTAAV